MGIKYKLILWLIQFSVTVQFVFCDVSSQFQVDKTQFHRFESRQASRCMRSTFLKNRESNLRQVCKVYDEEFNTLQPDFKIMRRNVRNMRLPFEKLAYSNKARRNGWVSTTRFRTRSAMNTHVNFVSEKPFGIDSSVHENLTTIIDIPHRSFSDDRRFTKNRVSRARDLRIKEIQVSKGFSTARNVPGRSINSRQIPKMQTLLKSVQFQLLGIKSGQRFSEKIKEDDTEISSKRYSARGGISSRMSTERDRRGSERKEVTSRIVSERSRRHSQRQDRDERFSTKSTSVIRRFKLPNKNLFLASTRIQLVTKSSPNRSNHNLLVSRRELKIPNGSEQNRRLGKTVGITCPDHESRTRNGRGVRGKYDTGNRFQRIVDGVNLSNHAKSLNGQSAIDLGNPLTKIIRLSYDDSRIRNTLKHRNDRGFRGRFETRNNLSKSQRFVHAGSLSKLITADIKRTALSAENISPRRREVLHDNRINGVIGQQTGRRMRDDSLSPQIKRFTRISLDKLIITDVVNGKNMIGISETRVADIETRRRGKSERIGSNDQRALMGRFGLNPSMSRKQRTLTTRNRFQYSIRDQNRIIQNEQERIVRSSMDSRRVISEQRGNNEQSYTKAVLSQPVKLETSSDPFQIQQFNGPRVRVRNTRLSSVGDKLERKRNFCHRRSLMQLASQDISSDQSRVPFESTESRKQRSEFGLWKNVLNRRIRTQDFGGNSFNNRRTDRKVRSNDYSATRMRTDLPNLMRIRSQLQTNQIINSVTRSRFRNDICKNRIEHEHSNPKRIAELPRKENSRFDSKYREVMLQDEKKVRHMKRRNVLESNSNANQKTLQRGDSDEEDSKTIRFAVLNTGSHSSTERVAPLQSSRVASARSRRQVQNNIQEASETQGLGDFHLVKYLFERRADILSFLFNIAFGFAVIIASSENSKKGFFSSHTNRITGRILRFTKIY